MIWYALLESLGQQTEMSGMQKKMFVTSVHESY